MSLAWMAILLNKGLYALVNSKDYKEASKHRWRALRIKNNWYAVRTIQSHRVVLMHRQILGLKRGDGRETDHKNHNGLDNRRCNLRVCSRTQNKQNGNPYKNGSSAFKGVSWWKNRKYNGKWQAIITYNGKQIYLGLFDNEVEAAKAYDKKARELFGEFAYTNDVLIA